MRLWTKYAAMPGSKPGRLRMVLLAPFSDAASDARWRDAQRTALATNDATCVRYTPDLVRRRYICLLHLVGDVRIPLARLLLQGAADRSRFRTRITSGDFELTDLLNVKPVTAKLERARRQRNARFRIITTLEPRQSALSLAELLVSRLKRP